MRGSHISVAEDYNHELELFASQSKLRIWEKDLSCNYVMYHSVQNILPSPVLSKKT